MTLGEIIIGVALAVLVSVSGLILVGQSAEVSAYQLQLSRFVSNEPAVRKTLQGSAGNSQRTRVYSSASNAATGSQALVSSTGPAIRMDYSGGANAGGAANWSAIIEYRSAQQRLIYRNINNGNEWVIAERISAASFSLINGVLVLDATMDTKPFSIYASVN